MVIIPAVDIKQGKCVRLSQGKADQQTIYYDNPSECARMWQEQGAKHLHVIDLDGAFDGKDVNLSVVKNIVANMPELEVQVGGGIRNPQIAVKYLDEIKVSKVIIGTMALKQPQLVCELAVAYPDRIYISYDMKDGKIRSEGWVEEASTSIQDSLENFSQVPLGGLIVTDIKNDGMLRGVDATAFTTIAGLTSLPVIAAGGITDLQDIQALKDTGKIAGVICGKSIYEKTLDLRQAIALTQ